MRKSQLGEEEIIRHDVLRSGEEVLAAPLHRSIGRQHHHGRSRDSQYIPDILLLVE